MGFGQKLSVMNKITRFTTLYCEHEDRFQILAELESGTTACIWLTQRLLQRLIPVLLKACDVKGGQMLLEPVQAFQQELAKNELKQQAPVALAEGSRSSLIKEVTVNHNTKGVALILKAPGRGHYELPMATTALRQWLAIICRAYRTAEWPMGVWPAWFLQTDRPYPTVALH